MDNRERLERAQRIDIEIQSQITNLESLMELAKKLDAASGNVLLKQSCLCSMMTPTLSKLYDLQLEAAQKIEQLMWEKDEVIAAINAVDNQTDLAALALKHLLPVSTLHSEQRRIRTRINELKKKISEQSAVSDSDYTPITEFSEEKLKKFIRKVIVSDGTVAFLFYSGITISKEYNNGKSGNKPGWNQEKEE